MAAVEEERVAKLKQVLVESLGAILSPDQEVRKMAEDQLKVLEVTEGRKGNSKKCFSKWMHSEREVVHIC